MMKNLMKYEPTILKVTLFLLMCLGAQVSSGRDFKRVKNIKIKEDISNEKRVFNREFIEMSVREEGIANKRTLKARKSNRAYEGAPPRIPHPVDELFPSLIGKDCKSCHVMSGYVKRFSAYAPMTPHPDWGSCRQCHVPSRTPTVFKNNSFEGYFNAHILAKGSTSVLPGGPPPIPHTIENRGKCLSCHIGLASIKRIKTTHPERANCRQCHVPSGNIVWKRGRQ